MAKLLLRRCSGLVAAVSLSLLFAACGGHKGATPASGVPARINLNPSVSFSIQSGTFLQLTASAQSSSNSTLNAVFTYNSSNPSILDISPLGFACAGTWNAPAYNICAPGSEGVVTVTASAFGVTSPPTYFFVHPPISEIQISVATQVNSTPPACPGQQNLPAACAVPFNNSNCSVNAQGVVICGCLSQGQSETVQATAFDGAGNDITAAVGPFTWTEGSITVAKVTPIVTINTYNVATNQATVVSTTPGQTQLIASAAGVFSQPFNIETCPVECIDLQLGVSGQQQGTNTNFVVSKGTAETITATAVDVQGCVVPKPTLTWTSSAPASLTVPSSCSATNTCNVTTALPGAGAITANCTPPACNTGYPLNPAGYAPGSIYLPVPVYPVTPISGVVTGPTSTTNVLSTSQDCFSDQICEVGIYNVSTLTNVSGAGYPLPAPPNSLMYDPPGVRAYVGSEFGSYTINPSNLGSNTSPFGALTAPGTTTGFVTGKVIAVSNTGNNAVFSDTVANPNQVYMVNAAPVSTTPLNLNGAIAAAYSPDSLKTFILADGGTTLNAYSALQFLQPPITLPAPATALAFNSSGSFILLAGGAPAGSLAIYRTADNSVVTLPSGTISTPPQFLKMVPGGNIPLGGTFGSTAIPFLETTGLDFFFGLDDTGIDVIATNSSGSLPSPCPTLEGLNQIVLAYTSSTATPPCTPSFAPYHINIFQGTFHPIAFFVAPSATQAYIVTSDLGVLIYNFNTNSVSKIPMVNNATPVAADVTVDGALIYVAGSDGLLHQLNPALLLDQNQVFFTPLPNSSNNFCFTSNSCNLNLLAIKP